MKATRKNLERWLEPWSTDIQHEVKEKERAFLDVTSRQPTLADSDQTVESLRTKIAWARTRNSSYSELVSSLEKLSTFHARCGAAADLI